ncbi:hypothetical protein B0H16DRAFT_1693528 [Mycena metata]|uniref:F-box domain-containing protein n=1 Tax=Mycena metata TaxID=1033252 RepID=A0AAD7N303_9AGAR|nr:hypothetical protein B0H16DRAFT_1693528 [Mycena metata]
MTSQLPDELWLEIFSRLPRETTLNLYQTHRRFRRILCARVFARFSFHPYTAKPHHQGAVLLLPPKRIERALERLAFGASPEVAPLVRLVNVEPYPPDHPSSSEASATDEQYLLLFELYERLVHFTCLQNLSCTNIRLTQTFFSSLCRLPELVTLSVADSNPLLGHHTDYSSSKLHKLRALVVSGYSPMDGRDYSEWIPLLRPEFLTELQLQLLPHRIPEIGPSFPTSQTSKQAVDIRRILPKFPALHILTVIDNAMELSLKRNVPDHRDTIPVFLPPLTEYTGPIWTLRTFLCLPTLTHLAIGFVSAPELLTELQSIGAQSTVTSLWVSVVSFTNPLLIALCDFFPALTRLRVEVRDYQDTGEQKIDVFLDSLAKSTPLPPHLTQLALAWSTRQTDMKSPIYPKFRQELTARYPAVDAVWLCFYNGMLLWRKTPDRDEQIIENAFEATDGFLAVQKKVGIMRSTFDYTWGEIKSNNSQIVQSTI